MAEQLPGLDWEQYKADFPRIASFAEGAAAYQRERGVEPTDPESYAGIRADPDVTWALGRQVMAQEGQPHHMTEQLKSSYAALGEHIQRQYAHLTGPASEGGMGVSVEFTPDDPYSNPREMAEDVRTNRRLKIFQTQSTGGHPVFSDEVNDRFRAIHDAFGHLATGRGFTFHGEEAAVQHHATMFPEEAHEALFSELRGQIAGTTAARWFVENRAYQIPEWATKIKANLPQKPQPVPALNGTLF